KDSFVRSNAASTLGNMGKKAATDEIIQALTKLLNDKDSFVLNSAAYAFANISLSIQDKAQANQLSLSEFDKYIPKLEKALELVKNLENNSSAEGVALLRRSLLVLKDKRKALFWNSLLKNPFIIIPTAYLIFFPSLWFLLLRIKPISLIQINEILKPYELCFPKELGGVPVKSRDLLLFSFFKFRPRVLDAWVKKNIPSARERFESKKTVQERSIHIPVAATLNNQNSLVVTGKDLKPTFNRNRACLLIYGEGGAGKTSLACQVGRWVMSDDLSKRPAQHLMLPVLIEEELRLKEHQEDETPLLEAIQGQLQDLIDSAKPIPQELLEQLLRQRRVLVIVDHFSEMSEATRKAINPDSANFCINALVVTSRLDEKLGRITKTTLHPHRINGDRLSSFMDDYLSHRGYRENFTDIEFFNACIQLSKMVGTRNITVLLAKLFAEQLISSSNSQDLPNNIPELMLEYLNQINRDVVEDKLDDRSAHKDAKILAWKCFEQTFRPIPITRENALTALGDDDAENRLNYLENRLHLIQTIGAAKDEIRFVLDPLAEYLAGLHLLEFLGNQQQLWQQFLQKAADTEDAPESIQGFLLALRDCYLAKGKQANIPENVTKQLENLPNIGNC
ncbi:MAG: PBS lyase, partial [Cyanobacteria bacterium P01_H01_bin.150]